MKNITTQFGDSPMARWITRVLTAGLVISMTMSGCAEPEEIDRVQPDLVKKSTLLDGEFYLLDTIVQAPYASHYMFPGLQSGLNRGVFEIEEGHLYFYRTYEFIQGIESPGIKNDTDTPLLDEDGKPQTYEKTLADGTVVTATRYVFRSSPLASYAITGHYDVRQQYNPLTGKPSNVTVEDASEKFWYQREFMRVNFGSDSSQNFQRFSYWKWFNALVYEGEEAHDDFAIRVEDDGNYMDFVVRGFMQAPTTYLRGWGYVPTCLFYPFFTGSYYECTEEEVHIRTAFKKVDPNNSYRPLNYDDHAFNKFGFYRSARQEWDQQYGSTYSSALRHIRRHRVFEEYVEKADGSLDYANMTPKPIVYYLSEDFPRELIPGAVTLADQWNGIFKETVENATGKAFDGRMFVLCENSEEEAKAALAADSNAPIAETDGACVGMDRPHLRGDLRYNLLVSVNEPVQYGLYGYGPMNSDPITGETIQANAFNYTANMRLGARNAVDYIEYAAGVTTFRDVTQAEHISSTIKAKSLKGVSNNPASYASMASATSMAGSVMTPQVAAMMNAAGMPETDTDWARASMTKLLHNDDLDWLWLNEDMAAMVGMPVQQMGQQPDDDHFLRDLVHPVAFTSDGHMHWQQEEERYLGSQAICMGTHFDDSFRGYAYQFKPMYDQAMCEGLKDKAGLVFDFAAFGEPGASCGADASVCGEGASCTYLDQGAASGKYCIASCSTKALLQQLRDEIRRVNQVDPFAYWDPNALYTSTKDARVLASQEAAKAIIGDIREKVFVEVFDRIWSTVAMHEVGHNLGMSHNFASSTDALNYFEGYWELKGTETANGWQPKTLFERDSNEQAENRVREYQQTSIMEYTGSFNARFNGLGSYDRAAIMFAYGELVEVFEEPPAAADWEGLLVEPTDEDPSNFGIYPRREHPFARALRKLHYTNIPDLFGGADKIHKRKVVPLDSLADKSQPCSFLDNPYDTAVCGGVAGSYCRPFNDGHYCSKPDMLEVPFRFCGDIYNWSTPDCQTHDEGTDAYQMVRNSIEDYESYWPFKAYKRDNDLFNPSTGYFGSVMYTFSFMRKHWEHWVYNYNRYNKNDWWKNKFGKPWHEDINGGLSETLAAKQIFETMANVFGRPSPGYYGWCEQRKRYEPYVNDGSCQYTNLFRVYEDEGARPIYAGYDFSGYIFTPARAGTIYDRLAAFMYMTYPQMIYVRGADTFFDTRRFRMSMGSVWPQRTQNLLTGLVTGDPSSYGWCIEHDGIGPEKGGNGDPIRVKNRKWFGTDAELDEYYANCTPLTPEPQYSFPTTQYRLPALATVYGMGWLSNTYDRSYVDRSRVWLEGEGNDLTIPAGWEKITFTHPCSGKKYIAPYDPSEFDPTATQEPRKAIPRLDVEGHGHAYWPTAQILAQANVAKDELEAEFGIQAMCSDETKYEQMHQLVGRIEIIRGLYQSFEYGY